MSLTVLHHITPTANPALVARVRVRLVQVVMVERLPVAFGLVRFGVAPDHPEVMPRRCHSMGTTAAPLARSELASC